MIDHKLYLSILALAGWTAPPQAAYWKRKLLRVRITVQEA
jgi:hypothetical protein